MISIVESDFQKSAVKPADYQATLYPEIAIVGKSNVGKSSLINTLLNRKNMAKVSSTPGKTRLINFFKVRYKITGQNDANVGDIGYFSIADLPGYGFAKVSRIEKEKWKQMVNNYFQYRQALKAVLLLIDIRHSADPKDLMMVEILLYNKIPFVLIATKSDKIPKNSVNKAVLSLARGFNITQEAILPFSSLKKNNLHDLLLLIEKIVFDNDNHKNVIL